MQKRAIVWFRQDLRLHDNEALTDALKMSDEIIPVYVFDERVFMGKTKWFGFPKTGIFRTKFIIEAVEDLRQNLQKLGSDLIVRVGKPEEVLYEIAREVKGSWIFCNRERTTEEVAIQDALEKKLWSIGQDLRYSRGKMLFHTADLPFPVTQTPDIFTQFRKETEKFVEIRQPISSPNQIKKFTFPLEIGEIPSLAFFGHKEEELKYVEKSAHPFKGGESEGLNRLNYYLWETNLLKNYKETRNELLGTDYSSKFSAFLAQGCLSPKQIYHEIKKYEAEKGGNESTYWLFFELLWRDFFRLMGKKYEKKIFLKAGTIGQADKKLKNDRRIFNIWADGKTGIPFIDANMLELKHTGFMSNRGRQNVASFLVKDLMINWQMGAEYFESSLIDYDVCSNWGNWNYVAGVGNDPREDRYFNIISQAKRYDSQGDYVKFWLPMLQNLNADKIHQPDLLSENELLEANIKLGYDYPKAMISTKKWLN